MKVQIRHGNRKPTTSDLENWQLGFDYNSDDLYIRKNDEVVKLTCDHECPPQTEIPTFTDDDDTHATINAMKDFVGEATDEAKNYADDKATEAETNAKSYADEKATEVIENVNNYAEEKATEAETNAKSYADEKATEVIENVNNYAEEKATEAETNAKSYADEKISEALRSVYHYCGTVANMDALNAITDKKEGAVYNVADSNMNYGWVDPKEGEAEGHWDPLGSILSIDTISKATINSLFN